MNILRRLVIISWNQAIYFFFGIIIFFSIPGFKFIPNDPEFERVRDIYINIHKTIPLAIPAVLLILCLLFLLWTWKVRKISPVPVIYFLGGDAFVFLSLTPLGISYGPPLVPLLCLWLLRLVISYLMVWLCKKINTSAKLSLISVILVNIIILGFMGYSLLIEPFALKSPAVFVRSDKLSGMSKPVKILHISDIHMERETKRERKILDILKREKPDLILMSGDYLNLSYIDDEKSTSDFIKLIRAFSASLGVYAVGGSIEYYIMDKKVLFEGSQVRLLMNEKVDIHAGNRSIELYGITLSNNLDSDRVVLSQLMRESDPAKFRILLYHTPDLFPEAAQAGIDLIVSGHTHGGQLCLPLIGPIFTASVYGRKYAGGIYHQNNATMIVSRGIGMEGYDAPRARLLSPPEIPVIIITGVD